MAQEYNIEHFLAMLNTKSFTPSLLKENPDDLAEALWYMDDERTRGGEVLDALINSPSINDSMRDQIITNLAMLFPLSRNLVLKILKEVNYSDDSFLLGFDMGNKVRKTIKDVLDSVKEQRGKLGSNMINYKQGIESLSGELEDLIKLQGDVKAAKDERDRLQKEVNRLKDETNEEKLKADINELETKKAELEAIKANHENERKKHNENIEHIRQELEAQKDSFDDEDVTRALRDLLRKFPKDEEDGQ